MCIHIYIYICVYKFIHSLIRGGGGPAAPGAGAAWRAKASPNKDVKNITAYLSIYISIYLYISIYIYI